jgi:S1-C subfamily serine protease
VILEHLTALALVSQLLPLLFHRTWLAACDSAPSIPMPAASNRALDHQLSGARKEFGDQLYDWAMYSTRHANRAQATKVMEGLAAAETGLAPGNVICSYADRRIFSGGELRDETTAGTVGETAPVDVVRDGEGFRVYAPRGPLGVMVEPSSQEPARVP